MDQFVELVRLYDTWEWEQTGALEAKHLNDLFLWYPSTNLRKNDPAP